MENSIINKITSVIMSEEVIPENNISLADYIE